MSRKSLTDRVRDTSAKGVSVNTSQAEYSAWAKYYEQDYKEAGDITLLKVSEYLSAQFSPQERERVKVIDIGAGTGLVAKELIKVGFRHIDALDPSEDMLLEAKKFNLYEHYFIEYLSKDASPIPANTYDALVGCGCYGEAAHVPTEALFEMIRLVKPGGFIVLTTRHHLITNDIAYIDLEPLMDTLEREGKWKKVNREIYPRCYYNHDGILWCYQVL